MPERGKGTSEGRKANRGPSAGPGNRRAIIAAAREVFATDGLQGPFNAIAKKAGVGQVVVSTALIDLIWQHQHDDRVVHLGERLGAVVGALVARERVAGRIGDSVEDADVLLAVSMLADLLARTGAEDRRQVAQRAWSIFHAAFAPR